MRLPPKLRLAPLWPALAAVVTATALLGSMLPSLLQRTAAVQLYDMLDLLAPIARERLAQPGLNLETWAIQLAADSGIRVTLIRRDGVVLADSSVEPDQIRAMQNHRDRPEVRSALASGRGMNVRRSATTGNPYVYVARTLSSPGGEVMILRLAEPLEQLSALRTRLAAAMALAILAAGIAILFTSLWLDRRLFEPTSRLISGAQDLALGRVSRVTVPDEEELAPLALALNRLAATAERQVEAVSLERDHLQEILASMSEGVLVVDRDGRAQMINPAFYRLFDLVGDFTGRPALEIIRHPGFARVIEDTLRHGVPQSSQIVLTSPERRTLLLTSAALSGGERGAVVAARDTTELTRVADMRRDFVANVSHELKTPLAAIRGYAETLRDGALDEPPTAKRFTDRILSQCRRLQELLDDLLILSRLEGMDAALDREPVSLDAIARHAVELLTPAAREKRVEIELREEPVPPVHGDAGNLERLLLNLLDNAIKYNRPDGKITVRVGRCGTEAVLEVIDSGIGIPPESISRIFERFYRVDKGRAREEGGTGLGLAIVKHIAQAHGGQVDVESRIGRGSTFRVRLPLAA
jgi:two-component system, OmpR family, phosphate regulon sensor histidine kinase PhoR